MTFDAVPEYYLMIIYMCIIYFNLFIFYSNNLGLELIRIFIVLQIILL